MVEEGKPAPDFELESDSGETVKLSELRGKPVVLYFYPKDDTPGCTRQACGIRDAWGEFQRAGAEVFGISADDAGLAREVQGRSTSCRSRCWPIPSTSSASRTAWRRRARTRTSARPS